MPIELVPMPVAAVASAVRAAVRSAQFELEPVHAGYASAWRRAGLADGVRRLGAGAKTPSYGVRPSRRSARGAIRA